jgi:hypothetical protein
MKKNLGGRPVVREDVLDHLERQLRDTPAYPIAKPHIDATRREFGGMERYVHKSHAENVT